MKTSERVIVWERIVACQCLLGPPDWCSLDISHLGKLWVPIYVRIRSLGGRRVDPSSGKGGMIDRVT